MKKCTICGAEMQLVKFAGAYYFKCPECGCWEEYE